MPEASTYYSWMRHSVLSHSHSHTTTQQTLFSLPLIDVRHCLHFQHMHLLLSHSSHDLPAWLSCNYCHFGSLICLHSSTLPLSPFFLLCPPTHNLNYSLVWFSDIHYDERHYVKHDQIRKKVIIYTYYIWYANMIFITAIMLTIYTQLDLNRWIHDKVLERFSKTEERQFNTRWKETIFILDGFMDVDSWASVAAKLYQKVICLF